MKPATTSLDTVPSRHRDMGSVPFLKSPVPRRGFFRDHPDRPVDTHLYLRPVRLVGAEDSAGDGSERFLVGSAVRFSAVEILIRSPEEGIVSSIVTLPGLDQWASQEGATVQARVEQLLGAFTAARPAIPPFPALAAKGSRAAGPLVMGILNVTPDSFSDGGDHFDISVAIESGLGMMRAGAALLDVGGESTRPGAEPVDPAVERDRVVPVIRALAERGLVVSVDTRHASVMEAALAAGARVINDVTALSGDSRALSVAARAEVPVILMHMQGEPQSMQVNPRYDFAPLDVFDYLTERIAVCRRAGIPPGHICVDPGIGFGKSLDHNLGLLSYLTLFHGLGTRVLVGASRKSFIGRLSDAPHPKQRLPGSLATVIAAQQRGMHIVRVHDVAETIQALSVSAAIAGP